MSARRRVVGDVELPHQDLDTSHLSQPYRPNPLAAAQAWSEDVWQERHENQVGRFWPKVEKTETCWTWIGAITDVGYGSFYLGRFDGRHKNGLAHRWAYEDAKGPIPPGLDLDHLCRNRACVNPDHLEPVTRLVNILRGESPAAVTHRTGKCQRGHDMSDAKEGRCRTCVNDGARRRRQERRESA